MRKYLIALAVAGALLVPASAGADPPPGYTTETAFEDAALPDAMKDCAHCRAKLLRWHLRNWNDDVVAKHSVKLAVGARNGHVFWSNRVDSRWDSTSNDPWRHNGSLFKTGGPCCGGDGRYVHSTSLWIWRGPGGVDSYWQTDLHIKAHVGGPGRGPNDVWFSKWSRFE